MKPRLPVSKPRGKKPLPTAPTAPARELAAGSALSVLRLVLRKVGPITLTAAEVEASIDADAKILVTDQPDRVTFALRPPIAKSIDIDDTTEVVNVVKGGQLVHRVVIGAPTKADENTKLEKAP